MNPSKLQEIVKEREPGVQQSMGSQTARCDLATEQQHPVLGGTLYPKTRNRRGKGTGKKAVKMEGKIEAMCLQVKRCHGLPDASRNWQRGMAWIFCVSRRMQAC